MSDGQCGTMAPRRGLMPVDEHGCILPKGHEGPHQFMCEHGRVCFWHTDWGCVCDMCMTDESDDWCVVFWEAR